MPILKKYYHKVYITSRDEEVNQETTIIPTSQIIKTINVTPVVNLQYPTSKPTRNLLYPTMASITWKNIHWETKKTKRETKKKRKKERFYWS